MGRLGMRRKNTFYQVKVDTENIFLLSLSTTYLAIRRAGGKRPPWRRPRAAGPAQRRWRTGHSSGHSTGYAT
jgi:hypothetical protein